MGTFLCTNMPGEFKWTPGVLAKVCLNVCMYGYRVNLSLLSSSLFASNGACGICAGSSGQEVGTH